MSDQPVEIRAKGTLIPVTRYEAAPQGADSVEAAALARLHDYMRRAPDAPEAEALIARDAFVAGFRYGARYMAMQQTNLVGIANPDFRNAIALLAEVLRGRDE